MSNNVKNGSLRAFGVVMVLALGAHMPAQADNAARLGNDLTPVGANPKASADGTIPAWTGGLTKPPAGYRKGDYHPDPYGDDKVLFTINNQNLAQYKSRLTPGQLELFKKYPDYTMPVYATRRSCAVPPHVYEATKRNATQARLTEDGNNVENAWVGYPFPVPPSAKAVYWNHNFHFQGYRSSAKTIGGTIYPSGSWSRVERQDKRYVHYADPQNIGRDLDNVQYEWMGIWTAPPRMNGSGFTAKNYINQVAQPRDGFVFRPETRKVARAPSSSFTHDAPLTSAEGLRYSNNMFGFSGAPDRYEWELKGKREVYIPYNPYRALQADVRPQDLLTARFLNRDYMRYELHRVWEVELTAKPNTNPTHPRRIMYFDEDSWIIVGAELYGHDGTLKRFQEAFVKNYYEVPTCIFDFDVMYDFESGRYNIDHLKLGNGPANMDDAKVRPRVFGSSALRRAISR